MDLQGRNLLKEIDLTAAEFLRLGQALAQAERSGLSPAPNHQTSIGRLPPLTSAGLLRLLTDAAPHASNRAWHPWGLLDTLLGTMTPQSKPLRVLVVDDDEMSRELLALLPADQLPDHRVALCVNGIA